MNLVIFLWNFKIGGVQKHTVLLANALISKGWDVRIFYNQKEGELLDALDKRLKLCFFRIPNTNDPIKLWQLFKKISALIPKDTIVLANGPNNIRQLSRLNLFTKRWRLIYVLHNDLSIQKSLFKFIKISEMRILLRQKQLQIIALTETQKLQHKSLFKLVSIFKIPNFIEFNKSDLKKLRKEAEPPRGLSLGRLAYEKGYDILLDSFDYLKRPIHIDVYGFEKINANEWSKKAKLCKVQGLNFFPGVLNTYKIIKEYDFLVLPSRSETFGLVIIEAFACGLPVLATDCDGPAEIVNASNGIVVKKENPQALAKGIEEMVEAIESGRFDKNIIREGAKKYSLELVAESYISLLSKDD